MGTPELKLWRDQLIGGPGDLLLEASRRYLGPVKTPFNKHQLATALEAWLRRPETARAILAALTSTELRLLALLHLCGPLPAAQLTALAADAGCGVSQRQTEALLVQLRHRLLVYYSERPAGSELVAINPVLRDSLAPDLGLPVLVACDRPAQALPDTESVWREILVLLSVAIHVKNLFRRRAVFSKKAEVLLETLLGKVDPASSERYLYLLACLRNCGIMVEHEDGSFYPEPETFLEFVRSFGRFSGLMVLAASDNLSSLPLSLTNLADTLYELCALFVGDITYSVDDCLRLIAVVLAPRLAAHNMANLDSGVAPSRLVESVRAFWDTLVAAGLLVRLEHGYQAAAPMRKMLEQAAGPGTGTPAGTPPEACRLVIEDSHELQLLPGSDPFCEAWVALMAKPLKADLVWTAVIDKNAAMAAFGFGFSLDAYCQGWQRSTGKSLPQSLRFSFESWYKEFSAVRVRQGVVVVLDEHLSWSLEHNRKAEGLVSEKLASGVYLLAARTLPEAEKLLAAAGIHTDVRGQVNRALGVGTPAERSLRLTVDDLYRARSLPAGTGLLALSEGRLRWPEGLCRGDALWLNRGQRRDAAVQDSIRRLLNELEELDYDTAIREVLAEKIRCRLIVDAAQLQLTSGFAEIVAGAMDYPGKVRLLERSLKEQIPVELSWTDNSGARVSCTGLVCTLEKQEDGTVIVVKPYAVREDSRTLPVRVLSKVRLLQGL